ncbi:MAG: hypothetical protein ACRC2R_07025 [Xenococcaceae cyanobacterium]
MLVKILHNQQSAELKLLRKILMAKIHIEDISNLKQSVCDLTEIQISKISGGEGKKRAVFIKGGKVINAGDRDLTDGEKSEINGIVDDVTNKVGDLVGGLKTKLKV